MTRACIHIFLTRLYSPWQDRVEERTLEIWQRPCLFQHRHKTSQRQKQNKKPKKCKITCRYISLHLFRTKRFHFILRFLPRSYSFTLVTKRLKVTLQVFAKLRNCIFHGSSPLPLYFLRIFFPGSLRVNVESISRVANWWWELVKISTQNIMKKKVKDLFCS